MVRQFRKNGVSYNFTKNSQFNARLYGPWANIASLNPTACIVCKNRLHEK